MPLKPLTPSIPDTHGVHDPESGSPLHVFGAWIKPTIQLHRQRFGASFESNMGGKSWKEAVCFSVFVLTGAMFEMKTVASSGIRHYMPILGPTTPPFSRWSWYPQPVGQSKLNNFFTYLSSRRVGSSERLVSMCKVVARGITACAAHRFLGSCFSSCMIMTISSGQVMGQA